MKPSNRQRNFRHIMDSMTLPRVQMFVILVFTGVVGFVSSVLLLYAGVTSMAVRYPAVIAISYGIFLALLKVWIWLQTNSGPNPDVVSINGWVPVTPGSEVQVFGGGGDYAGAGSGGEWTEASLMGGGNDSSGVGVPDVDVGLDLDDLGALILAAAAILAACLAVFYVIYIAPVLLAEILFDAMIVSGLYRSIKNVEKRYWLTTAIRKTFLPAILLAVLFGVAGFLLQKVVPEAASIGEVWHALFG